LGWGWGKRGKVGRRFTQRKRVRESKELRKRRKTVRVKN